MCGRVRHLRGVDRRRDAGIELVQGGYEFRDVSVFGLIHWSEDALDHPLIGFLAVIGRAEDAVRENAAQNGLVLVMMGIDKPGHDDHAAGVQDRGRCIEVASDREDLLSAD